MLRNSLIALAPFPPGCGKSFPAYFRPDKPIGRAGLGPGARTKIRQGPSLWTTNLCASTRSAQNSWVILWIHRCCHDNDNRWTVDFSFIIIFFSSSSAKVPSYILFVFLLLCQGWCVCGGRTQLCHRCLDKRNRKCVSRTEWIKASKRVRECGLISQIFSFLLFVLLSQKVTSSQNFVVGVGMFTKLLYGRLCMGN